jgi:hypothetical protein
LFFVLSVNAFDLRKLQRFFTQLEDGHSVQIIPFYKSSVTSGFGFSGEKILPLSGADTVVRTARVAQ